ncbi:efflux transporter outer membrane subunit [Caldimonas tepidiphila]|uniref:efflux transporter outer membrane subunit n=1 Tax=Caldimonas tepidiphila TaxID=2315841 RepID=UPI001F0BAEF2|nr:efflux transporter outer membrane subunit [Caldimonas tepidiphila]
MPPPFRPALAALVAAALLAGCGTLSAPAQQPARPALDLPAQWQQAQRDSAAVAAAADGAAAAADGAALVADEARWWQRFGDPALDALVQEALARNNDLAAATIRVRRAQLQAGLAAEALAPDFGASLGATSSRTFASGGASATRRSASASVSWETDLWGRLARTRDAAQWAAEASAQDREATALSLAATTATLYWQLAYLNQRIALSEQSIAHARRTLQLVEAQRRAGAVSALELREASRSLATQEAAHTQLLQQRVETRHAFALLFDAPPQAARAEQPALPDAALPAVDAGLPAGLLARRPDLRAAELRLRSLLATEDAARAAFYPRLTLTGSLGTSSSALASAVSDPVGTLGAALALPLLQWRELRLNRQVAQADYDAAVAGFRQTLYQALAEVEDALSAGTQYAAQGERLQRALEDAREAERLYELRYRAGAEPLRAWLDAQQARRQAEAALLQNRLERLQNRVTLHQALGGDARAGQPG